MTTVFIKLLNMSIAASWLILAVILLRVILKNAPKWIRCILWGLVAVRLICPISIESIFSLIPSAETIPQNIMYAEKPAIHTGVMAVNSVVNPYLYESMAPKAGASINPMQVVVSLAALVWVVGMSGMLIYAVVSFLRIKNKTNASLPVGENIYFCDYIDTPFVLGVLRPRIYLPSTLAEDVTAEFVIAHEKAHIRRRDHCWKPLGFLLLTIYWFNPVIWVAYILLCRDIELACDEYVIGSLKEKEKKSYSDALLACSMKSSGFSYNMISACPLAFGEVGVKDRVKAVLHYKRPAFWLVLLGLLACIVAAICFLTDPADNTLNASEPFGHSYRVEEVVYGDGRFSFGYTVDTAPRYQFTSDYTMFVSRDVLDGSEGEEWVQQYGKFEEVKLSPLIFDDYFKNGAGLATIRVNTEKAWRIDVEDDENGVFYYFILTKQGEVYLTYGYDVGDSYAASEEGSLIRWVFKLARTDILDCNAVSEGSNSYVQPAYYPKGFDWDYEQLPQGYINEKGVLVFYADWDTDSLVVSEDYYNNYDPGNRSVSTFIERETYTLERNKDGQFELNVELRSANGDMAVFFVQGQKGVYVFKVIFEKAESVSSSQGYKPEEILGISYLDFLKLTGITAEHYHTDFYTAVIPNTEITAVLHAEGWDDKSAIAILEEDDPVIRLECKLGALMNNLEGKMSLAEFFKNSMWSDRLLDYNIEQGTDTAYYVAENYVTARYDLDGDTVADRILQIALKQSERISEDSYCWVVCPFADDSNVDTGAPDWGITLSVKKVKRTGLTLICTKSGGEPTGEVMTEAEYRLEVLENGSWISVPTVTNKIYWSSLAYFFAKDDSREFKIDWEWMYGKLPKGTYRIVMEFMDYRAPGDYDEAPFYAEFKIK